MSVLTLDLKVFNYIHSGMTTAAYRTQVDEFYSYSINVHFKLKDIETESQRLIKSWMDLNEKSYDLKYKETSEIPLSFFFQSESPFKPLTAVQLLKYTQCLVYNIELEHWQPTDQENADYNLLKNWCNEIQGAIVSQLPEYKNAAWSEAA